MAISDNGTHFTNGGRAPDKKKAAWFPRRPFLSYGGATLAGDFRTSAPGAYFPAAF
jgi:hypothetical protein